MYYLSLAYITYTLHLFNPVADQISHTDTPVVKDKDIFVAQSTRQ